jgi:hypothetical protein
MLLAQALLEKGMLDGMTFSLSAVKESLTTGSWVWLALAVAVFFLYKRLRA